MHNPLFWYHEDEDYDAEIRSIIGLYDYHSGATKIVFTLDDIPGYVFKIPFNGEMVYDDWDAENHTYIKDPDKEYYEYGFVSNWNDYFAEKDLDVPRANHCEWEYILYSEAKDAGLEKFFTSIAPITHIGFQPVYVSEYCPTIFEEIEDETGVSKDSMDRSATLLKENKCGPFDNCEMLALFIDAYGFDEVLKLLNFLVEYKIKDLHSENIGLLPNGKPVILDYAGFCQ
jgi:hypothetical protein